MKHPRSLATLLVPLALAGCGGGSGGASSPVAARTTGTLTILWPPQTREIPASANSLQVTLASGGTAVSQQLIARPAAGTTQTTTSFANLPIGSLSVGVVAFPNADGTGQAQAVGSGSMTTAVDVPGAVTISLVSTVATLTITPTTPRLGKGATATLTANAKDAAGNIVLLAAGAGSEPVTWTSDTPAVATVTGTGPTATLRCLTAGTSLLHASFVTTDAGATVTTSTSLTVVAGTGSVTIK